MDCDALPGTAEGTTCNDGACQFECAPGWADCDGDPLNGCETDIDTDVEACGACNHACEARPNSILSCKQGACTSECSAGWMTCGASDPICSTNIDESIEHCGGCNQSCADLPGNAAAPSCAGGVCDLQCETGTFDCDGDWRNGCELSQYDLEVDPAHCGACNNECPEVCVKGTCSTFDFEYASWPVPSLTDRGTRLQYASDSETVIDLATGLEWQREGSSTLGNAADAVSSCEALRLGGHEDWRLPTHIELLSLVDLEEAPYLDTDAFPDVLARHASALAISYWAGSKYPFDDGPGWIYLVDFLTGLSAVKEPASKLAHRCVRGGIVPKGRHYTIQSNTVIDWWTGLAWEAAPDWVARSLEDAEAHCSSLGKLDGIGGWRLPNILEHASIVDVKASDVPTIDHDAFGSTQPPSGHWSSTVHGGSGICINYFTGATGSCFLNTPRMSRCVADLPQGP